MSPTENIRFEELVSSYLDSRLSEAQEYELLQILESPAYGRAFLEMTRIDGEIKGLLSLPVADDVMANVVAKEIAYSSGESSHKQSRMYKAVMETIEVHTPRSTGSLRPGTNPRQGGSGRFIVHRPSSEHEAPRPSLRITKPTTPWAMAISIAFHAALIVLILGIQFAGRNQVPQNHISNSETLLAQAPVPTNLPTARIEAVSGEAIAIERSQRKLAEQGRSIGDGEAIETVGLKSSAGIKYPDGSLLMLNPDTKISQLTGTGIDGAAAAKSFYVDRGIVSANVFKQPAGRPMTVVTSNAEATVVGTRFTLAVAPGQTRLDVTEGLVRLTRLGDKRFVYVRAGEYAVVADGVDFAVKSLNPIRTFIMGVNFYGPAVTIEGNRWLSHTDALVRGLKVENFDNRTNSQIVNFDPIPPVDADMRTMLNSRVYSIGADMDFKLALPNGDYEVVLYIFEPHKNGSRVFDVEFNGVLAKRGAGRLKMSEWERVPMRGTVKDGVLHLHFTKTYGNPAISGMAIFKLD
ncbi:MAG TPA: FecR domain-containing protein [Planctomycetota bacterium]|nr:FecR domain-containing protein [Planctomycetota bacterium]